MAEDILKAENYILIQGWMVKNLHLKNNELMVYAIIYGFSQDGEHEFRGSSKYLCEWTGASKKTVLTTLKNLVDKGLVIKKETEFNGQKFCNYMVDLTKVYINFPPGVKTTPHNIDIYNSNNNYKDIISNIINYLNYICGVNFSPLGKKTSNLIISRLNEGFKEEDFKVVIDNKFEDWGNNPEYSKFLRPETLFGNKFEGYLNQKPKQNKLSATTQQQLEALDRADALRDYKVDDALIEEMFAKGEMF